MQGTEEWFAKRLGKVTASRIGDVMAKGRSGAPSATRKNYMAQLVAERLTGVTAEGFTSPAIERGKEMEAEARLAYEIITGVQVAEIDFVEHPQISFSGASPDGLVGDDGLIEIKCPNTATHIDTLRGATISKAYRDQMQWQMACTGRRWCDFTSYDPRMPESMQLHVQCIYRDDEYIDEIESEVKAFLSEMDTMIADLCAKYQQKDAA